jgi:hypothetical protein
LKELEQKVKKEEGNKNKTWFINQI